MSLQSRLEALPDWRSTWKRYTCLFLLWKDKRKINLFTGIACCLRITQFLLIATAYINAVKNGLAIPVA